MFLHNTCCTYLECNIYTTQLLQSLVITLAMNGMRGWEHQLMCVCIHKPILK